MLEPAESVTEYAATFGAVRRFRAALADALDVAVQQLLAEIAENVLARELTTRGRRRCCRRCQNPRAIFERKSSDGARSSARS